MKVMKNTTENCYGIGSHLILDCYGCPGEKLEDTSQIYYLLDTFPARLGLTKISSPSVFKHEQESPDESGITGIVLVAEAHVSLHTFPAKGHVFIDIFSNLDFDADRACRELIDFFGAQSHEASVLNRNADLFELPRIFH
jgi:S-adenosylmethionine decarboxylase